MMLLLSLICYLATFGNALLPVYNETEAFSKLFYASSAYCLAWLKTNQWNCHSCKFHPGFELSAFLRGNADTYGYVGVDHTNREIIVGFKGTNPVNLNNWLNNLKFDTVPYIDAGPQADVHEGFYTSYLSMKSQLFTALDNVTSFYVNWPVSFVGHSMGGSNAMFAALDFVQNYTNSLSFYSYGQPRTGNVVFAAYAQRTLRNATALFRVIHNRDPVPHVPPLSLSYDYMHMPTEVWYDTSAMVHYQVCSRTNGEDPNCSDGQVNFDITDHIDYFGVRVGNDC